MVSFIPFSGEKKDFNESLRNQLIIKSLLRKKGSKLQVDATLKSVG